MEQKRQITKDSFIEDLVIDFPFAVQYLTKAGIRCLICGEPIWGTLESAAKEKGFSDERIQLFVDEMNAIAINSNTV